MSEVHEYVYVYVCVSVCVCVWGGGGCLCFGPRSMGASCCGRRGLGARVLFIRHAAHSGCDWLAGYPCVSLASHWL